MGTVAIACPGTNLVNEDGTYTVDSVTATQLFLSGRTIATRAADDSGTACTFTVTRHTSASALDGYYNIDSVAAGAITFDRSLDIGLASSTTMSCIIKKIRDSPCT